MVASKKRAGDPKCLRIACFRFSPTPGSWFKNELVV
jgi:hypothetical protein